MTAPDAPGGDVVRGRSGAAAAGAPAAPATAVPAGRSTPSAPATPAPAAAPTGAVEAVPAAWTTAAEPAARPAGRAFAPVGLLGQAAPDAGALATAAAQAQAAARAAAAADRDPADRPTGARATAPPVRPRTPRTPGARTLPGGLRTGQLVAVEAAAVAVLAVHRQPPALLVPVAVVALVVVLLALVRRDGRWGYEWADLWLRHRAGRSRHVLAADAEPAARADGVLDAVVSGGWLDQLDLDGVPAALWTHAGGLTVAIEVSSVDPLPFLATRQELPPVTSLLPAADEGGSRFTVQVLEQTLLPPAGGQDPAALSHQELTGGTVPALRRCWVALQVVRSPADEDAQALRTDLSNATRRVLRRLRRAGLRAVPLGPDDAVAGLLGLVGARSTARPEIVDGWRTWGAGDRSCTSFVLQLPAGADAAEALADVRSRASAAGVSTTVALAARRVDETGLDLQVTVRAVLAGSADLDVVTRALADPAGAAGATLRRLDGEQAAGVAATLPLGGFLR